LARLEALPDNGAADAAAFFPLPDGYSVDPKPFSDAQIADLKALFSTAAATPPEQAGSGRDSGTRSRAA
jgi:hypothetical protein